MWAPSGLRISSKMVRRLRSGDERPPAPSQRRLDASRRWATRHVTAIPTLIGRCGIGIGFPTPGGKWDLEASFPPRMKLATGHTDVQPNSFRQLNG